MRFMTLLQPQVLGHQLQVQAPSTTPSLCGTPALKLGTQVMPTHRLPSAWSKYPLWREKHGGKWRFFELHEGWAREGCHYPAIMQNITLEEEGTMRHVTRAEHRGIAHLDRHLQKQTKKRVCEMNTSPGATAAFNTFSAKCPVPSPESFCSLKPSSFALPLHTTI